MRSGVCVLAIVLAACTPAGVELLVRSVLDTGLFTRSRSIQRHLLPGASPNLNRGFEWLSIRVKNGDQDITVSTFARDAEDGLYTWDAGRERLLALADRLADLSWLPAGAWFAPSLSPYVAVYHRLYVETAPNLTSCSGPPATNCFDPLAPNPVTAVWPFTVDPGQLGVAVPTDPNLPPTFGARCAILTADDARILGEAIARTNGTTYHPELRVTSSKYRWPAGSGDVYLQLEPLLPIAAPTCAGVSRQY